MVNEVLGIVGLGMVIAVVAALAWWLLIASEGVYLGRRMVIWLYDLYAHRYDGVKNYYREYEHMYLAQPIMDKLAPLQSPLVLDVATGTGRLPLAMARHGLFEGRTVAVDLSRRMLHFASQNIYPYEQTADFIWCPAENLPFADNTFDVVTCLEALEFMTNPEAVLAELARVLRPGGLMLITQRVNTRWMPGKLWTSGQIQELLAKEGIEGGKAQIWQVDYRKVWGKKSGASTPTGARPLEGILRCPKCQEGLMKREGDEWMCEKCGGRAKVGEDGVIELFALSG